MTYWRWRASVCEQSGALFSAYLDGRLPTAERQTLLTHLSQCPSCTDKLETLRLTVSVLRQIPQAPLPRSFLLQAPAVQRTSALYYYFRNATAAVAVLFIAVLSLSYFSASTLTEGKQSAAPAAAVSSRAGSIQKDAAAPADAGQGAPAASTLPPTAAKPNAAAPLAAGSAAAAPPPAGAASAPAVASAAKAPESAVQPAAGGAQAGTSAATPVALPDAAVPSRSTSGLPQGQPDSWRWRWWPKQELVVMLGALLVALIAATAVIRVSARRWK